MMKSTARAWGFFPTCCGSSPSAAIIAVIAVISVLSLSCVAPSEQPEQRNTWIHSPRRDSG